MSNKPQTDHSGVIALLIKITQQENGRQTRKASEVWKKKHPSLSIRPGGIDDR